MFYRPLLANVIETCARTTAILQHKRSYIVIAIAMSSVSCGQAIYREISLFDSSTKKIDVFLLATGNKTCYKI